MNKTNSTHESVLADGGTVTKLNDRDDSEYFTSIDGRAVLMDGTPLSEVIGVFERRGLGTWFQVWEVRDECAEYDAEAVYATVEFLKEVDVVDEDCDYSVMMDDTEPNRALVEEHTDADLPADGPTLVHKQTGIQHQFDSMDELAVHVYAQANHRHPERTYEQFALTDSGSMEDVYFYGADVLEQQTGFSWIDDCLMDPEVMLRRFAHGEYDGATVSE